MSKNLLEQGTKETFMSFNLTGNGSMYAGSNEDMMHNEKYIVVDGKLKYMKVSSSSRMYKIIDEAITNAVDQYVRMIQVCADPEDLVTNIDVKFDRETGEITIYNNGKGIEITEMEIPINNRDKSEGVRKMSSVQAYCTEQHCGVNSSSKLSGIRITGGVNGIGLKLIVMLSHRLKISTLDKINKVFYEQEFYYDQAFGELPNIDKFRVGEPKKRPATNRDRPGTTVSFIPAYNFLNHNKDIITGEITNWYTGNNISTISGLIHARCMFVALWMNYMRSFPRSDKKEFSVLPMEIAPTVTYNGNVIKMNIESYFSHFGLNKMSIYNFDFESYDKQGNPIFPWVVGFALIPESNTNTKSVPRGVKLVKKVKHKALENGPQRHVSIINGLGGIPSGNYFDSLILKFVSKIEDNIKKRFKKTEVKNVKIRKIIMDLTYTIDIRNIPGAQFNSQSKDSSLQIAGSALSNISKNYNLDSEEISRFQEFIEARVIDVLTKEEKKLEINESRAKHKVEGFQHARLYNKKTKNWTEEKFSLFLDEGESAGKLIDILFSCDGNNNFDADRYGKYNLRGVPMNAYKQTSDVEIVRIENDDSEIEYMELAIPNQVFEQNEVFWDIEEIIGLNHDYKYYAGGNNVLRAEGDEQFKTLHYKEIILCTDQDIDGIGHIRGLIIAYIMRYWPDLIKRNFIKQLQTPIIRAYPKKKGKFINFYSQIEFEDWAKANFGTTNIPKSDYSIKYYKGLASHSQEEAEKDIYENFHKNIVTLKWDTLAQIVTEDYYGKDTAPRKEMLTYEFDKHVPDRKNVIKIMNEERTLNVSDALHLDTRDAQIYFQKRKMKSAIDGLLPVQRKVLESFRRLNHTQSEFNVTTVSGWAKSNMNYHQGESGINSAIIKMSQKFYGSNNIPPLLSESIGSGSRKSGRDGHAAARYIKVKYNPIMSLLFPTSDNELLLLTSDDGKLGEPEFYVPVLPYSVLETSTIAGVAHKIEVWARNIEIIHQHVINLIAKTCTCPDFCDHDTEINVISKHTSPDYNFVGEFWKRSLKTNIVVTGNMNNRESLNEIETIDPNKSIIVDDKYETVTITQLPAKMSSDSLIKSLMAKYYVNGEKVAPENKLIESIHDSTGIEKINIEIRLAPGKLEYIMKNFGTDKDCPAWKRDPFINCFGLYNHCSRALNMINETGMLRCYKNYMEVIANWFIIRKRLYKARVIRMKNVNAAKVKLLEAKLKYIELYHAGKFDEITDQSDNEIAYKLYASYGLPKIDSTLVESKTRMNLPIPAVFDINADKTDPILDMIYNSPGADYSYIDNMTTSQVRASGIQDLKKSLEVAKKNQEVYQTYNYRLAWTSDLKKLIDYSNEADKNGWK